MQECDQRYGGAAGEIAGDASRPIAETVDDCPAEKERDNDGNRACEDSYPGPAGAAGRLQNEPWNRRKRDEVAQPRKRIRCDERTEWTTSWPG